MGGTLGSITNNIGVVFCFFCGKLPSDPQISLVNIGVGSLTPLLGVI
jgi:hypothetical protein